MADVSGRTFPFRLTIDSVDHSTVIRESESVITSIYSQNYINSDLTNQVINLIEERAVVLIVLVALLSAIILRLALTASRLSSRLALLSRVLMCFILIQCFISTFAMNLIVIDKSSQINNLQDVLDKNLMPFWRKGSPELNFFKESPENTVQQVYQRAIKYGLDHCLFSSRDFKTVIEW